MSSNKSTELQQYVAEQVSDYIINQTTGALVAPDKMKILEKGVYNICSTAYPEYKDVLSKQIPRLLRAVLDIKQLNLSDKVQRIIDAARPKDDIINGILGEITNTKIAPINHSNLAKNSWAYKIQSERKNLQKIER